jgi:hypothetical protein
MNWLVESLQTLFVEYAVPPKLSDKHITLGRDRAHPRCLIVVVNRLGGA